MTPPDVGKAVADAHRREWGYVLAATARVAGNLDLAEECVQDAYVSAMSAWVRQGIPDNPAAWLTTVARRRALDAHRRDQTLRTKLPLLISGSEADSEPDFTDLIEEEPGVIPDDRLRLVFTCCHPALAREAQVALTLRLVCGLTTAEIAQAFLVSEPTMAARVTRAKKKIAAARIAYRVPAPAELPDRLDAVLTVVHLVFTTGHGFYLTRHDLITRALDLGRMLLRLMPDEREVRGLLALMLLTDARRAARTGPAGELLLLEAQDRELWDLAAIREGSRLVEEALRGGRPGRFALQAAIAAVHSEAPAHDLTDWAQIWLLYGELLRVWPSPVVALNRTVAFAMVRGPEAALPELALLEADERLAGYHYLPATKADFLRRLGRTEEAAAAYRQALDLCSNEQERAFLTGRLGSLG